MAASTICFWPASLPLPMCTPAFPACLLPLNPTSSLSCSRSGLDWTAADQPAAIFQAPSAYFTVNRSQSATWASVISAGRGWPAFSEVLQLGRFDWTFSWAPPWWWSGWVLSCVQKPGTLRGTAEITVWDARSLIRSLTLGSLRLGGLCSPVGNTLPRSGNPATVLPRFSRLWKPARLAV